MSENEAAAVWVAVDTYPESTKVIVAATEKVLWSALVENIGRDEYDEFVSSLKGDEATDVTFDDDPLAVLKVWSGDREEDVDGYWIGGDWKVRCLPVLTAAPTPPPTGPLVEPVAVAEAGGRSDG